VGFVVARHGPDAQGCGEAAQRRQGIAIGYLAPFEQITQQDDHVGLGSQHLVDAGGQPVPVQKGADVQVGDCDNDRPVQRSRQTGQAHMVVMHHGGAQTLDQRHAGQQRAGQQGPAAERGRRTVEPPAESRGQVRGQHADGQEKEHRQPVHAENLRDHLPGAFGRSAHRSGGQKRQPEDQSGSGQDTPRYPAGDGGDRGGAAEHVDLQ